MAFTATLDQFNLREMNGAFHPKAPIYTFISGAHETFPNIDNVLGYKLASLN